MIDENLPIFYWKASKENVKHDATLYLAQYGNDPVPAYTLRYPDPASADSRNRYAAALYDCYNPDILFGEVLLIPEWAQAQVSAEEQRKNGGIPPKPEPQLPHECSIQLYNPDQQVALSHSPSKWNASEAWEFELPQQTFRQPSASALDRSQNDPSILEATPTIPLKWKRESKLSKDLTLFLAGKQRNPDGSKKKQKEPDIPIAFFKNLREITIYEPNLSRIDIEDPKGFEVIVLLSATIIRDVYHDTLQHAFNITEIPHRGSASEGKAAYAPPPPATLNKPIPSYPPQAGYQTAAATNMMHGALPMHGKPAPQQAYNAPPTDPRSQWELDAETARLRQASEAESKAAAKERRKQEKKSERTAKQLAEEEQRAARARQAAIDAETERLRKAYASEQGRLLSSPPLPPLPPRNNANAPSLPPRPAAAAVANADKLKKDKKDKKGKHANNAIPSIPSPNFLTTPPPQMGPSWMPGRPASATGHAGGGGWGGPPHSAGYVPPPPPPGGPPPANPWNRQSGYAPSIAPSLGGGQGGGLMPIPPQQQSSGLFGGLFSGHGRNRSTSDVGTRQLAHKRSSIN